ncbi:hypothetical protein [Desulfuromonas thiophila]|uniref:Uncharacterized protein n=1 Tax=Desulfuromonas thiophila TaxID=57664 RepID=A0A1G6XSA2_9BACT|nr:hypothetical protein [Desulfuromonas thiophila]SDD81020.1 hypothetical protein SAMN05661003_101374 [Desulfuromonas thiophila]
MVGGFNHNFCYQGQTFHLQTEDSGPVRARITSLLYLGGTIIARQNFDYPDWRELPDLTARVEAQMKSQHKQLLRDLHRGAFDDRIAAVSGALPAGPAVAEPPVQEAVAAPEPELEALVRAYLRAGRD